MTLQELTDLSSLAILLNIKKSSLTYLLYKVKLDNCYSTFEIPKKNGSTRTINAPNKILMKIQKKLLIILTEHIKNNTLPNHFFDYLSYGYEKDRSIYDNAKIHNNKKYVLNIDLQNFFDQFHFGRIRGFFQKNYLFQLNNNISHILANIVCFQGKLPQGAPTSPIITNIMCKSFDKQILNLAKKYKLHYTRYVDDLSFSTNDKYFIDKYDDFITQIQIVCNKNGFPINEKKIKLQQNHTRQVVTGLCVNKKVNIFQSFYKQTRAMANSYYKNNTFNINNQPGTINQLLGRLTFISHIDKKNNPIIKDNYYNKYQLELKKFLFVSLFLQNEPLIITEGITDIIHIKTALKKFYKTYPDLIDLQDDSFVYKIKFLHRSYLLHYLFNIEVDGADTLSHLSKLFKHKPLKYKNKNYNFYEYFKEKYNLIPSKPIIFILDNELNDKNKPINKFLKSYEKIKYYEYLSDNLYMYLNENMYLLTLPLVNNKTECEIEDMYSEKILQTKINGKYYNKNGGTNNIGKKMFAVYIKKNFNNINFDNFIPILDNIINIINHYNANHINQ